MRIRYFSAVLFIFPVLLLGQFSGSLRGPSLGFVFDSSDRTLHPILGITGSATVGPALDPGFLLINAISLADDHTILAVPESGESLLTIDFAAAPPVMRQIDRAAKTTEVVLSSNGNTAALIYRASSLLRVLTGLPHNPVIAREITLPSGDTPFQHAAVNDA